MLYRGHRLPSRLAERGKIEVADDRAVAVERVIPGNGSLWTSTGPLQPDPGHEALTEAPVLLRRPQLADAGVHRRPDEHRDRECVEPDEQHDRRRQRTVDRSSPEGGRDRSPHDVRRQQPDDEGDGSTRHVTEPGRPVRCGDVVEARETTDGEEGDDW